MNLVIDIGNSTIKLAVFDGNSLIDFFKTIHQNIQKTITDIFEQHPNIKQVLVSSVSDFDTEIFKNLPNQCKVLVLNHTFKFPIDNLYQTPKSLGLDRLALVSGAVKKYPNSNILIIDAGTCITYDFVDSDSKYHGGAISPGLQMRYKALNEQTSKLPLLKPTVPKSFIGHTTDASIHSGIIFGITHEISGVVADYRSKFPELKVVLTGGDHDFLFKQLKISIFAVSNLLLEGLNYILEFNSNK